MNSSMLPPLGCAIQSSSWMMSSTA